MLDVSSVDALRGLRLQFQQDTEPERWPVAAERELTLLADVCGVLGADEEQVEQVLGSAAAAFVVAVEEAPL